MMRANRSAARSGTVLVSTGLGRFASMPRSCIRPEYSRSRRRRGAFCQPCSGTCAVFSNTLARRWRLPTGWRCRKAAGQGACCPPKNRNCGRDRMQATARGFTPRPPKSSGSTWRRPERIVIASRKALDPVAAAGQGYLKLAQRTRVSPPRLDFSLMAHETLCLT